MSNGSQAKFLASTIFYSVVISAAFRNLSFPFLKNESAPETPNIEWQFAAQICLLLIILEDWYSYFSYVLVDENQNPHLTMKNLLFELMILFSWYIAFASLPYSSKWFAFSFSGFFLLKCIAGIDHYKGWFERSTDFIVTFPSFLALLLFFTGFKGVLLWFPCIFTWFVSITLWHIARTGRKS